MLHVGQENNVGNSEITDPPTIPCDAFRNQLQETAAYKIK